MKKVIVFALVCLMMSGCAYCRRCKDNKSGQIKEDMKTMYDNARSTDTKAGNNP